MSAEINSFGALVILGFGSLAFFFMLGVFLGPVTPINNIITFFQCNDHGTYPVGVGFGSWICEAPDGKKYNSHWGHSDGNSSDYPRFDEIKTIDTNIWARLKYLNDDDNFSGKLSINDINLVRQKDFNVQISKKYCERIADKNNFYVYHCISSDGNR